LMNFRASLILFTR